MQLLKITFLRSGANGNNPKGTTEFLPVETGLIDGEIAFRQHIGGHTSTPNWETFLTFASRYIKRK